MGEGVKSCPRAGCGKSACPERVRNAVLHHTSIQNRCEGHRLVCRQVLPVVYRSSRGHRLRSSWQTALASSGLLNYLPLTAPCGTQRKRTFLYRGTDDSNLVPAAG